ncbi:hypothetical protein NSK_002151 [Nannochloropsis salina CCMP1776]|uniref:Uncharacterized protein n=1 Tax=Nannochloropsis salina CCMP1776 TaxID=1027361 RepID=A0A4D9D662_9STRA|nr:hypothetical protein NSK_002151 [Nannochloropsis salina CCMP1776]|eukprot:TFJ86494.1 hypothetical protein NSK_002151 [Nannochloropsis salina CCMP1776]
MAIHLLSNKKIHSSNALSDILACVFYLRTCACIASSTGQDVPPATTEAFFHVLKDAALKDKRLQVSLEAINLLYQFSWHESGTLSSTRDSDVPAIAKVLQHAVEEPAAQLTTLHAVFGAMRTMAKWLVRYQYEGEKGDDFTLVAQADRREEDAGYMHAGVLKRLRNTITSRADGLESSKTLSTQLRLSLLQTLIWLVPSLPRASFPSNASNRYNSGISFSALSLSQPGGEPALSSSTSLSTSDESKLWQDLERRLAEAPAYFTDVQLGLLLEEGRDRMSVQAVSSSSGPSSRILASLLSRTSRVYFNVAPTDAMVEYLIKTWEGLLSPRPSDPVIQAELLAAIFCVLDLDFCPKPESGNTHTYFKAGIRPQAVWQTQGQVQEPSCTQKRAIYARLLRLASWFLGEHALRFTTEQLGVIVLRLQTLSLFSDCFTQYEAVQALCKVAVCCEHADIQVELYEFLRDFTCADLRSTLTGINEVGMSTLGEAHEIEDQAQKLSFGVGNGFGSQEDCVAATLEHLRGVFRDHLKSLGLNPPEDPSQSSIVGVSLFVVQNAKE